ncbi:MAG: OsmC family protein [Bacteroidia bacterium]|nr:OsmC family protein [Bacteroidia bacterium]MDW8158064.1 OsmC family protein [Bacteroidia bacterium]
MNIHSIECKWQSEMAFAAQVNGHSIMLDAEEEFGGHNKGPRPKPLVLVALAGCTAMDVIAILSKMKLNVKSFTVKVDGELAEEHPKTYQKIHITYQFEGDLPYEKVEHAVKLSQEKYCGVSAMLRKAAELTYSIEISN